MIIDNQIDRDGDVMVIAISTKCQSPCPSYHIKVHSSNKRDGYTGLSEPSWAKCNFVRFPKVSRIKPMGDMPDDLLDRILKAHDRIADMGPGFAIGSN